MAQWLEMCNFGGSEFHSRHPRSIAQLPVTPTSWYPKFSSDFHSHLCWHMNNPHKNRKHCECSQNQATIILRHLNVPLAENHPRWAFRWFTHPAKRGGWRNESLTWDSPPCFSAPLPWLLVFCRTGWSTYMMEKNGIMSLSMNGILSLSKRLQGNPHHLGVKVYLL